MDGIVLNMNNAITLRPPIAEVTSAPPVAALDVLPTPSSPQLHKLEESSPSNLRANFEYDQQLKQIIITLQRADNGDVVFQIPPERVRHMMSRIIEALDRELDLTV
ncbi:MAG: flagellar protein FlaG [Armatimonadota bacterium]